MLLRTVKNLPHYTCRGNKHRRAVTDQSPTPPSPGSFVLLGCFLICSWFWNDFWLIFLYWKKYRSRNRTVTDQLVDTHWILMIVTNLIKCRQFLLMAVWGFPEVNKTYFSKNVNSLTNWADRLDRQRLDMKMFSFSFFLDILVLGRISTLRISWPRHMYSSVIIEVYSSNIANTYLSLRWIPRVRVRARTITPAITWSRSWKSNRGQNCCKNLKNKISATSFCQVSAYITLYIAAGYELRVPM